MRLSWKNIFFIPFMLASITTGITQTTESPSFTAEPGVVLNFRQEFNSYAWLGNAAFKNKMSPRWYLNFNESFKSSLLRLATEGDRWKDDQSVGMEIGFVATPKLTWLNRTSLLQFQDKQSGYDNDVSSYGFNSGLLYTPWPFLKTQLSLGPKQEKRLYQSDRGLNYEVKITGKAEQWHEYDQALNLSLEQDRFQKRLNSNLLALYQLGRTFSPGVADSLQLYFTDRRRDNYVSFSGDVESQREKIKGGKNTLHYRLGRGANLNLTTFLEFKNVDLVHSGESLVERRRKRNDQRLANDLGLEWQKNRWSSQFSVSHVLLDQRYDLSVTNADRPFSSRTAFITPDNSSSRFMMTSLIRGPVTRRDSLSAYFSITRFRYDTPDTTNFDDRDELRMNSRLVYTHRFSSELTMEWLAALNLYHMVYIFGERSADNNWNRILLLRPLITYRPAEWFQLNQSFEVLANYVDYDFEQTFVSARSFVFRKFALNDSLRLQIMPRSALLFDYQLQLEENGQLNWDEWSERIVGTRSKQWLHAYWQYTVGNRTRISAGLAVYKRDEWKYTSSALGSILKEAAGDYISYGPVFNFYYQSARNLRINFDATRYKVETTGQRTYYVNTIELGLKWYF